MKLLSYLKGHVPIVLCIVVLLALQALCDLALPTYTSDIVDVGIAQNGIENAAARCLNSETFDDLCLLVDADDEAFLRDIYVQENDGIYYLSDTSASTCSRVNDIVELPLALLKGSLGLDGFSLSQGLALSASGPAGRESVLEAIQAGVSNLNDSQTALIPSQAISALISEYKDIGFDVSSLQLNYLLVTAAKMLGLAALGMAVAMLIGFLASRTAAKIARDLRNRMFDAVLAFTDAQVQHFSVASLITRATNDVQQIQMVTVMFLRMVLFAPIMGIGGVIMIAITNGSMGWVIACAVCAIGLILVVLIKVAMPKFRLMQKLIDKLNQVAREMISGLSVIRAFGRQAYEQERFDAANTHLMKTQLFTNRVMAFLMPSQMLIMNLTSVAIVWYGSTLVDLGTLQTGDLIASITYAMVIIMGFLMIGMISIMLPRANVAAGRIDEVLSTTSDIVDLQPALLRDAELPVDPDGTSGAEIAFHNVSFKYGDASEYVLQDISFTAHPGQTLAIIGSTGCGKTTVLKLIERFMDVSAGSITLDGIDIRELSQHTLRENLGYVPQEAFLFSGTIAQNIAYSDSSITQSRIDEALEIAQAADFVAGMPDKASSYVSQGGTNVSGGQRQRLTIARALASKAKVFLFDDSFSALDYATDARLRAALRERLAGKTILIVAQRISTVLHADEILVLDEGKLAGKGTHRELMQSCDAYREIAFSQLSAEELGV